MAQAVGAGVRGVLVGSYEDGGETRQLFVGQRRGCELYVAEVSDGPLTQLLFGVGPRYHEVRLDANETVRLGWLLGAEGSCASVEDFALPLVRFFGGGARYLSDLMDEMDAEGIRYGYLSCVPEEGVWYRPARGQ